MGIYTKCFLIQIYTATYVFFYLVHTELNSIHLNVKNFIVKNQLKVESTVLTFTYFTNAQSFVAVSQLCEWAISS